eukprot:1697159-Rhodomonas_salina.1
MAAVPVSSVLHYHTGTTVATTLTISGLAYGSGGNDVRRSTMVSVTALQRAGKPALSAFSQPGWRQFERVPRNWAPKWGPPPRKRRHLPKRQRKAPEGQDLHPHGPHAAQHYP